MVPIAKLGPASAALLPISTRKLLPRFRHIPHHALGCIACPTSPQLANALAFISRSTFANMIVVASNTRPSHARAVRAYEEKLCGVQPPGSARIPGVNRLVATSPDWPHKDRSAQLQRGTWGVPGTGRPQSLLCIVREKVKACSCSAPHAGIHETAPLEKVPRADEGADVAPGPPASPLGPAASLQ
jgi:hypothetical protein